MRRVILAAAIVAATAGAAQADGAAVFDTSCAFCHQAGGVGVPGQFPRLAGRVGAIAAKPEGKAFLGKFFVSDRIYLWRHIEMPNFTKILGTKEGGDHANRNRNTTRGR